MYNRLLLILGALLIFSSASFAQIVGGNVFLQGHWLEIGIDDMGAFGTCSSPPGYHAHNFGAACFTSGAELDACYDWGHDGWSVGAPCEMGDYTIPGYPQEGWGIQANGTEYRNWAGGAVCTGPFNIPGSITGYTNSGGVMTGTFTGAVAGLNIIQETRVDTEASSVVVTTRMYNTTGAAITGVYYERTCDPDNTSFWPGGGPTTWNVIVHQNEDAEHRVMVAAYGAFGTATIYNRFNSWLSLATKDCRAKCFVMASLFPTATPSTMWSASPGSAGVVLNALNDSNNMDQGIALIFNIGNIAPLGSVGDSAVVSYAYIYDGPGGIDSAFPDPQLVVAGTPLPVGAFPTPSFDTFDVCAHPGMDTAVVNILGSTTGHMTWSHWTWAPATGLTSTTGTTDTIITSTLPAFITYTITATDSSGPGVMLNCENRVFYLTILTCNLCTNNSPCEGDTLYLKRKGDSTACTYLWSGPAGFTSTMQDPFIYPSTLANTGEYYVIRTLLGVHDTDSTNVIIHPLPVLTVSSNAPLCTGMIDTLLLHVLSTPAATFNWTGPDGFTSTLANPTVNGFLPINAGTYVVTATTPFGCTSTGSTDAILVPPPPAPGMTGDTVYCFGATYVPIVVSGVNIMWYAHDTSTIGTAIVPTVNTFAPGYDTFYATQQIGSCLSPKDSIRIRVYPRIDPGFKFFVHRACSSDEVDFTNTTLNSDHYSWNFGDGTNISDPTAAYVPHSHIYAARDSYLVKITGYNTVCSGDTTITVDTRHSVKALFTPVPDTFCVGYTTTFNDASAATVYLPAAPAAGSVSAPGLITNYLWNFGDGSPTDATMSPTHQYNVAGTYQATLIVTDSITCQDTLKEYVYVLQIHIKSMNDTTLCLSLPLPLYNTITLTPNINISDYKYVWTQSSQNLDDSSVHVPHVSGFGNFTDYLTVTLPGIVPDGCPAYDTITIHSVKGVAETNVTPDQTIPYGSSIDLNASGQVRYYWVPNDGSLNNNDINNPVATPLITTTYTVFGYDYNGCLDSAMVTITVDTTMHQAFPGAFTPNGDGLNDVLHPLGLKYQKLVEYRIYNRWGQEIFYSNDINKGWDGNFNGVPQDLGVYYYVMIVAHPGGDGRNIVYKGDFTLLR